jgi:hypothetical protein
VATASYVYWITSRRSGETIFKAQLGVFENGEVLRDFNKDIVAVRVNSSDVADPRTSLESAARARIGVVIQRKI